MSIEATTDAPFETTVRTARAVIVPRVLRHQDAPGYLGMSRDRFDLEVRPKVREVPIGPRGVGFDRLDLDAWFDDHYATNGRDGKKPTRVPRTWGG